MATSWILVLLLVGLAAASPVPARVRAPAGAKAATLDRRQSPPLGLVEALRPRVDVLRHQATRVTKGRAVGADPAVDPYRLPTSLHPTYYEITLTPTLSGDFTFDGVIEIRFNALEDATKIVLHSKELTIAKENCEVYTDKAGDSDLKFFSSVSDITYDTDLETATFTLEADKTLEAGLRYALRITKYTGKLNDDMDGFYRSSYKTSSGETTWLATTQFEPTGARRAFPCFDEPSYKSRYQITIVHDSALTAISNMPIASTGTLTDGTVATKYQPTLPISSYLVAFIVSDFGSLTNDQKNFTTWARQDIVAGGDLAQDVGPKALQLLADFNGIEYSLPKMDQAAIPDFAAGAMENWGLVTYREPYLIKTADTTTKLLESIATVICHEFGHQWTGDLVTLDWWSHTWLNEGFASFFENMICDQIETDWNLEDKMLPTFYHVAMESDVRETQVAMSAAASSYDDINDRFGVISYDKGGSVLRMFYHALTPEVFKKGMKRYLSVNMFKNTNPEHLFRAMDAEVRLSALHQLPSGVTFSELASTWTEQPGVPVLGATRDYTSGSAGEVTFTQKRFLYAEAKNASLVGQKWYIPLVVTTQASPDFDTALPQGWLDPSVESSVIATTATADQWVLVNPKETGYFRVNYDDTNWQLLAAALEAKSDTFPAATRAQLLNDALALARAGQLKYDIALPFLKAYAAERSVAAWQTASAAIKYLLARLDNTDIEADFLLLIQNVTAPAYTEVGYAVKESDSHEQAYLRYIVASFACHGGNAQCLADAAAALKAYIADPTGSALQPDTRDTTLCYGIRGSDADTFEAVKALWQQQDNADRSQFLSALACSANSTLIQGLLSDAVAKTFSNDDGVDVFNAVYADVRNHAVLLAFLKENADAVLAAFGNNFDVQVIAGLIEDIRTRTELEEVRTWVAAKYQGQDSWTTLQQAFDSAENELKTWFDNYYATVFAWLSAQYPTAQPDVTPGSGGSTAPSATGAVLVGMAVVLAALRL